MSNELRQHLISHRKPNADFERENRYIVLKRKHLGDLPKQLQHRLKPAVEDALAMLPKLNFLVIESDWPEYEPAWAAIEARMTGAAPQPPALGGEPIKRYDMSGFGDGMVEREDGAFASFDDLAPLQAEIERLKETVEDSTQIILQQGDSVNQLKARCDELERLCIDSREAIRVDAVLWPKSTVGQLKPRLDKALLSVAMPASASRVPGCADAAWLLYDSGFYDQHGIHVMPCTTIIGRATAYAGYKPAGSECCATCSSRNGSNYCDCGDE